MVAEEYLPGGGPPGVGGKPEGIKAWASFETIWQSSGAKPPRKDQWKRTGEKFLLWQGPELAIAGVPFRFPVIEGTARPLVVTPEVPELTIPLSQECARLHILGQVTFPAAFRWLESAANEWQPTSAIQRRYLLYSGLWFPVAGYGVNRFTSTINMIVPSHMVVIGSGKESSPGGARANREKTGGRDGKLQDIHLHLGQAEFSGHDHRGHVPGIQERRSGPRPAHLFQASPNQRP